MQQRLEPASLLRFLDPVERIARPPILGGCPTWPKLEETIYLDFATSDAGTGALADAASFPTAAVYEDGNDTAILTPTVVKRAAATGKYYVPVACTVANGFEAGRSYNVHVAATVGAVAGGAVLASFQLCACSIDDASTYAGGDTSGSTTFLSRIPGTVQPQSGDTFARIGAAGAGLTAPGDPGIGRYDRQFPGHGDARS